MSLRPCKSGQARLIAAFEALDDTAKFGVHTWERPGGGGGTARVLEGGHVLERAGINFSAVHGDAVPPSLAAAHPGSEGKPYFATGLSMVFHPRNPYAPAFHANYRYFEVAETSPGDNEMIPLMWWFGGGADMTPNYPFAEDATHFHRTLKAQCDRHPVGDYQGHSKRPVTATFTSNTAGKCAASAVSSSTNSPLSEQGTLAPILLLSRTA